MKLIDCHLGRVMVGRWMRFPLSGEPALGGARHDVIDLCHTNFQRQDVCSLTQ
jgi:hypothetical protein